MAAVHTSPESSPPGATPSARHVELLEAAYRYVLEHGLSEMSLRPLATAIGTSPRVLLYLFGSKDGLIRALLARARADELAVLHSIGSGTGTLGDVDVAERVWDWLVAPGRRGLLVLWVEAYARSLVEPQGPWGDFARTTVDDWLDVLARAQPPAERHDSAAAARRTGLLAVLRGGLLDLLATGDTERITTAVHQHIQLAARPDTTRGDPTAQRPAGDDVDRTA